MTEFIPSFSNARLVQGSLMQDEIILDLLTYWENLRAGRIVPARSDIDPREIKSALDHTFILEHSDDCATRFRLAGIKMCDLLGMELRGMPAHAVIAPEFRDQFNAELAGVLAAPKIVELYLSGEISGDRQINARMLLLPMHDKNNAITRVLGCLSLQGNLKRAPIRFDITDVKTTRIVAGQSAATQQGFSETSVGFDHGPLRAFKCINGDGSERKTPNQSAGRSHLRLVKDD
ncbi:hypothetical protein BFP76_13345 [Amylibacter kogurei]|uniref:PAS domain-containing protein n=1 Tax=Paramylibacter kogurei TaxID=1889778 RepID=A0A2G5KAB1_9RHOB|nr:PAS domain-containing protein [Amylibacter kogurei]PIB25963.1 hypothetical protein BFP76_13345 [Amylibacter kogurei]